MSSQASSKPLPFFYVGKQVTSNRVAKFQHEKQPVLSKFIGKPETRAIWYSFHHIEELYNELKHLGSDGVRVYLGTYEEDHPDFANQLCLMMVPTRMNTKTNKHEDTILEQEPGFELRTRQERNAGDVIPGGDDPLVREFNYGSPCPPVCPEHDLKYP